jgi:CHAT domain-containing protein
MLCPDPLPCICKEDLEMSMTRRPCGKRRVRSWKSPRLTTAVKNSLGELYAGLGRDELARERFESCWAVWAANDQSRQRSTREILTQLKIEAATEAEAELGAGFEEEISRLRQPGVPAPSRMQAGCKDLPNDPRPLWKADALLTVGRSQEALAEYQKYASGDAYRGEIPEVRAAAWRGMGDVYMETGDSQAAFASYLKAVEVVESMQGDLRLKRLTSGLASRQAGLYAQTVELAVELGRENEAFSLAERGRARAFLNQLGNRRVGEREKVRTELEEVRKEHARVLERIRQESPEYANLVTVDTLGLDELRKLLEPEVTLVEYFVLDDRTVAWVVDRERAVLVELEPSAAELERQVEDLRGKIHDRNAFRELSGRLYADVFSPLEWAIRHDRVVVVPHGALHYLPFAALWNPAKGRHLVESYTFTSVPSASSLRYLGARRSDFKGRLLALGNPEGNLDAAEAEVRAIAALFDTKPYVGSEASESLLRRRVHLAAHGHYVPHAPFSSHIVLAGDGARKDAALESDGALEVGEVYGLDLGEADLVVLSACDTALGQLSRGDDVVGLARAFLQAGAPLLVSTLWEVDDRSSAALMEGFYRHLLEAALTPAAALRQAQLDVLRTKEWSAPFYWAAFLATGVDRPLRGPQPASP